MPSRRKSSNHTPTSVAQTNLMDQKPAPAAIVCEKTLPDLGVTEITLANGVRVILKPTTFKKDEVLFSATSPGGSSLVTDADYPKRPSQPPGSTTAVWAI